jgi:hypothetical protein
VSPIESTSYTPPDPGVVADLRGVAGDREQIPDSLGVSAEEHDSRPITVESRGVRCGIVSIPTLARERPATISGMHADARGRVVVDVHVCAHAMDRGRDLEQALVIRAERWVDLDRA